MPFHPEHIELKQPLIQDWIKKHASFASYDWLKGNITFRQWLPDGTRPNHFYILVHEIDGIKPIRIIIKFILYPNSHVYVYRKPHVL